MGIAMKLTKITFEEYAKQIQGWYDDAEKWRKTIGIEKVLEHRLIVERLKKLPLEKIKMSAMIHMTNKELEDFKELQKILEGEK